MGPDPELLAIAGDWHGALGWSRAAMEYAKRKGATALLHVGDFGYWPAYDEHTRSQTGGCYFVEKVREAARELELPVFWLDGNHENHDVLIPGQGDEWVRHLPRGHRWSWWGKQFMAVGGAFSIDRFMRKEGVSYWQGELLTDEQLEYAKRVPHGLDVIFSHDCPTGINIPGIGPDSKPRGGKEFWPPDMLAGAARHRKRVRQIWDTHHPQRWYHGHYHVDYEIWYGPTRFRGLDCDGARGGMSSNVTFLEASDLK